MKLYKKIALSSVSLLALVSLLWLMVYNMRNRGSPDELWAFVAAVYFVLFPCISGVMLKLTVNDRKLAILVLSVCLLLWSTGSAVFLKEKFVWELLLGLVVFPIIMLFYFFAYLIVKREKKTSAIVVMIVSTLGTAFIIWLGVLFFLSLLGWGEPS